MTEGGGIAKETVTPVDNSVDAATVGRWLNCSPRMVRQYAEEGLAVRTGPGRFDLERSVGNVVLHLRELAASRKEADGADVVKASAALKDVQPPPLQDAALAHRQARPLHRRARRRADHGGASRRNDALDRRGDGQGRRHQRFVGAAHLARAWTPAASRPGI